MIVSL